MIINFECKMKSTIHASVFKLHIRSLLLMRKREKLVEKYRSNGLEKYFKMNFLNMETLGNFAGQLASNNNNNSSSSNNNNSGNNATNQNTSNNYNGQTPLVKSLYEGLGTVIDSQMNNSSANVQNTGQQNSNNASQGSNGSALGGLGSMLMNNLTVNDNSTNQNSNNSTNQNAALYEGLGAILSNQLDNAVKQNNTNESDTSNEMETTNNGGAKQTSSGGGGALSGLASMLTGGGGGSNNTGDSKSAAFGAIESVFKSLPQEQQKGIIMECISPVILKLSPKWGPAITGILKNFDVTKLIPLAKDEKKLVKTVVDEEEKLEEAERKKTQ